jgi:hypothetical protein
MMPNGGCHGSRFENMFEDGRESPADAAADLVVYLATGAADSLSGRFFSIPGEPSELVRNAELIRDQELAVLRVRTAA